MHSQMKLGRKPVDPRRYAAVPLIGSYYDQKAALPLIADTCSYRKRMSSPGGMLGNDQYGDCGFASIGHLIQSVCANVGLRSTVTTDQVLGWYGECTGFDPDRPETDNGVVMLDALKYFMRKGVILGYGRVDQTNPAHVAAALEIFGGLYAGFGLPIAWQSTDLWTAGPTKTGQWEPWSWGGHAVSLHSYDEDTDTSLVTWDSWVTATKSGRVNYCDELYAVILPQWVESGRTIQGLDLDGLRARVSLVD